MHQSGSTVPSGLIRLRPQDELQVVSSEAPILVTLRHDGGVEVFGEPLVPGARYVLMPLSRISLLALMPSELELVGVPLHAGVTRANEQKHQMVINLATAFNRARADAFVAPTNVSAPRVMVVGPLGRSSTTQTLTNYALRTGWCPCIVNLDPGGRSTQIESIYDGEGVVIARFPELFTAGLREVLERAETATANDKMQTLREWVLSLTLEPARSTADDLDRQRRKRRGHNQSRAKAVSLLSSLGRRESASLGTDEVDEAREGEDGRDEAGQVFTPTTPLSLSAWERIVRPLIHPGTAGVPSRFMELTLGVWAGFTNVNEQTNPLMVRAAKQLAESVEQKLREREDMLGADAELQAIETLRVRLANSSGLIIDTAPGCSPNLLTVLADTFNVDHIIVCGDPHLAMMLETGSIGRQVYSIPQPTLPWGIEIEHRLQGAANRHCFLMTSSEETSSARVVPRMSVAEPIDFIRRPDVIANLPTCISSPCPGRLLLAPLVIARHTPVVTPISSLAAYKYQIAESGAVICVPVDAIQLTAMLAATRLLRGALVRASASSTTVETNVQGASVASPVLITPTATGASLPSGRENSMTLWLRSKECMLSIGRQVLFVMDRT